MSEPPGGGGSPAPDPLGGPPPAVFLVGATASGKGAIAYPLAERLGAEIVSLDSMKVYRGLDAGTNKPSAELRARVPTHLVDAVDPWEDFSVERYRAEALRACADVRARGRRPLLVGGTPLYLKALLSGLFAGPSADASLRARLEAEAAAAGGGASLHARLAALDPEAAARIHPNDLRRIIRALEVKELTGRPISDWQRQWSDERRDVAVVGLRRDREDLRARITERVERMFAGGLVEETRALLVRSGERRLSRTAAMAIGTRQVLEAIEAADDAAAIEEAKRRTIRETTRYARQQLAWFRRFPGLVWFDVRPGTPVGEGVDLAHAAVREAERLTAGTGRTSRN